MSTESEIIQGSGSAMMAIVTPPNRPTPATRIVLRSRVVVWSTASVLQIADVLDDPDPDAGDWISLPLIEQGREVDAQIAVASIDYYHQAEAGS